jgi:hypothetical protein
MQISRCFNFLVSGGGGYICVLSSKNSLPIITKSKANI